jgi:hypothetical protein
VNFLTSKKKDKALWNRILRFQPGDRVRVAHRTHYADDTDRELRGQIGTVIEMISSREILVELDEILDLVYSQSKPRVGFWLEEIEKLDLEEDA